MKKLIFVVSLFLITILKINAQNDPILFSVKGKPVHLSEFNYIYTKTNGVKADFSRASVEEYLDLYTKFKMKVARAHDMKLDTLPALIEELEGYRRQLADSYLTDKEVTERLIKEVYERMQKDINISHILFKIEGTDTLSAYTSANAALVRLSKGESFEKVAQEMSQDDNTKNNGGLLGYITAMLPDGFYGFESAVYNTPVGKTSNIVRSPMGYHIVKINSERPARGEIEVAHIVIRKIKDGVEQPDAKKRIDSLAQVIQNGGSFEELAQRYSEDSYSAPRSGYLGYFGIGRYELGFENACFNIEKDGACSNPYESSIGWHIIKRISKKGIQPYEIAKVGLKTRILQDSRHELAKATMLSRIKIEGNLRENKAVLDKYLKVLDSTFITYNWNPATVLNEVMIQLGDKFIATSQDFTNFLNNNPNKRVSYAVTQKNNFINVARQLYSEFVDDRALAFEETQLESKYDDFKNLMREYEEGILLFEAIKQNVWDKASLDSVGLEKFYNSNKNKYMWDERAQLIHYMVADSAKADFEKIKALAEKKNVQDVLKKYNKNKKEVVTFREETVEKGKAKILENVAWKEKTIITPKDTPLSFTKIEKILPKSVKSLREARGYIVADYQEYLEKQWMEELKAAYKVEVNQKVLNSIIK